LQEFLRILELTEAVIYPHEQRVRIELRSGSVEARSVYVRIENLIRQRAKVIGEIKGLSSSIHPSTQCIDII
jgi:hypothetical protein